MTAHGRLYVSTTYALCDRGRLSVPALVELSPGRCLCSECIRLGVEKLVEHYGDADVFMPAAAPPDLRA